MQNIKLLLILAFLAFIEPVFAQTDSTVIKVDSTFRNPRARTNPRDTIKSVSKKSTAIKKNENAVVKDSARLALEKMPRKAMIRSIIFPGLGQLYNKRWWKLPLVYGGFFSIWLVYDFNQRYYKEYLSEVQYRTLHNQEATPKYAAYRYEAIVNAKDYYRRNRDLSILGGVAFYAIQVIDAYVDAKLFRYDISDELSLKVIPSFQTQSIYNAYAPVPSLKIRLSL